MITQDFAQSFVVSKQAVRGRAIAAQETPLDRKIISVILAGAVGLGLIAQIILSLLIQSGQAQLTAQTAMKAEMIKTQNGLSGKREALLDQKTFALSAEKLGLYLPDTHQVRRL